MECEQTHTAHAKMHDMDWNDLRFARAVAQAGSLSGAARVLAVHQTTVGRRLDALEAAVGFPLFLRTPSGLSPTADGKQILASVEELASALTRFERGVAAAQGTRGLVRVAITEAGARQILEGTVAALLVRHPELSLEIVPSNIVLDLARGDADLAIRLVPPDPDLVARTVGTVRYGLYAARAYLDRHGKPTESWAGHAIVRPSRELARGPEATWLATHAGAARTVLHVSSLVTAAVAVEQGLGLTVLPQNLAAMHPGARLVRALPEIPARKVYLVMHPEQRRVERVRVVAKAIAEEIGRRLAQA